MILFIILTSVSTQRSILIPLEKELAYHMIVEHTIFFILGATSVRLAEILLKFLVKFNKKQKNSQKNILSQLTNLWTRSLRNVFKIKKIGFIWLIITILILYFWHVPSIFDYSELHPAIHALQHLSFIVAGTTAFLSLRSLGESYKIFLIVILSGMMGLIGLLFSLTDTAVFNVYSVGSHNYAGSFMVIVSVILLIVGLPLYIIKKTLSYTKIKIN